ncbi:MAG TPA: metal-dependent hydrolase [Candidatus Thermoplasmatota archaeon]
MRARWLSHSAWLLEGDDRVVIDPFLTGNPKAVMEASQVQCDIVVVTHGHNDHFGDAVEIAKANGAPICAIHEIAVHAESEGAKTEPMNKGGSVRVGRTTVRLVEAVHSGDWVDGAGVMRTFGTACGAVVTSGKTVYHAGDTALFSDMRLIGELYKPDLALLPIGDRYTMGPQDAGLAAALVGAPLTVPMHYQTWPAIPGDPREFAAAAKARGYTGKVRILKPGDAVDL